eukprot:scaffold138179_cov21-Tisochrysis_lutea.AAC.1
MPFQTERRHSTLAPVDLTLGLFCVSTLLQSCRPAAGSCPPLQGFDGKTAGSGGGLAVGGIPVEELYKAGEKQVCEKEGKSGTVCQLSPTRWKR